MNQCWPQAGLLQVQWKIDLEVPKENIEQLLREAAVPNGCLPLVCGQTGQLQPPVL